MGPINCLFYAFSAVPNSPYYDTKTFPELKVFEENWEIIRDEAINLNDMSKICTSEDLDDGAFNSFFRTGWKRFYLMWFGSTLDSANHLCPKTMSLLNSVKSVKGAMFTMLPPGARLGKHRDPYAGTLRYQLGLLTPNSEDCSITVDGKKYSWRDGEAVMFDGTYIHHAENKTENNRIILFLDVKRPVILFLIDWVNAIFSRTVIAATVSKNSEGDKVGFINKIFAYAFHIRILGIKIKSYNKALYYILQDAIYVSLIYGIFFYNN